MIRKQRKYLNPITYCLLSLFILVFLNGCINECQTNNPARLILRFDSLGKKKAVKFSTDSFKDTVFRDTMFIPLDLNKDITSFSYNIEEQTGKPTIIKKHSGKLSFSYTRLPYIQGADCGVDIKVNNFDFKDSSSTTKNTFKLDNKNISKNNFYVEIRLY